MGSERSKFYEELVESLIAFAEFKFGGGDDKFAAAEQWERLGKSETAEALLADLPKLPHEAAYLWLWFINHLSGLEISGTSPSSVTWQSLAAWCELQQIQLEPWEISAMVRMGNIRLKYEIQRLKTISGHGSLPQG